MAKYFNSPFGTMSGTVAGQVTTTWKGIKIVKGKASHVNQPNTVAQETIKSRFALATHLASLLNPAVKIGLKAYTSKMTANNVLIKQLFTENIIPDNDASNILYADIKVAQGNLEGFKTLNCVPSAGELDLSWTDNSDNLGADQNDSAYFVILNTDDDHVQISSGTSLRQDGSLTMGYQADWVGQHGHGWAFFFNKDGEVSTSEYLGALTFA